MSYESARDRYHFAKLCLFNIRLLNKVQNSSSDEVQALVRDQARFDRFESGPPPLLHQGTFLQFAYICMVWLWESAKREGLEEELLESFVREKPPELELPTESRVSGERKVRDWKAVIRMLRNAISHGRVVATDGEFVFKDQDRWKEKDVTELRLTWAEVALISESMIHSLTPVLWPREGANAHAQRVEG
jgi:hypothetical protein